MKLLLITTILLLSSAVMYGQYVPEEQKKPSEKKERNIQVFFDYKNFAANGTDNYIETYLQFSAYTIEHQLNKFGKLQGELEVTQIIKQEEEIVDYKKYSLKTPEVIDSVFEDFTDIQRFSLKPGLYQLELEIRDIFSSPVKVVTAEQNIEVKALENDHISLSDIELIAAASKSNENSNFTKSGYHIIPQVINFYDETTDKIAYYVEIYRSDQFVPEGAFALKHYIEDYTSGNMVDNTMRIKRMNTAAVVPYIGFIPVETLESGNYDLVIELLDKDQKLLYKTEVFFQRSNPKADVQMEDIAAADIDDSFVQEIPKDSLLYNFESVMPIASINERKTIVQEMRRISKAGEFTDEDEQKLRKFLHVFWKMTEPNETTVAFHKYQDQVRYVEEKFGTAIKEGFRSDRGRVYLQYGPPNSVVDRPNEPSSYPYQIWHYYKIGKFSNKKFVFYQPDLVNNDYEVLHSDLQGEIKNYRWQHDLHKRNSPANNIDNPNDGNIDHFGGNSNIYFKNDY